LAIKKFFGKEIKFCACKNSEDEVKYFLEQGAHIL